MDTYRIADLKVEMACSGKTLSSRAAKYLSGPAGPGSLPDIRIDIKNAETESGKRKYPHLTPDEWEYIQTGSAFYRDLLDHGGFGLHSSAVGFENRALLFSGPCGAGKSTHASLWRDYFGGDKAVIINDDKPALRFVGDVFYAYGTPWSGKTPLNADIKMPLGAVVFIRQAKENNIRRLDSRQAIPLLICQSLRQSSDATKVDALLTLIDALLQRTPVYQMDCDISFDAVRLAYETICQERMTQK